MFNRESCKYYSVTDKCVYCQIEHCPARCDSDNNREASTKTEKPSLLIFRINKCQSHDDLKIARQEIIDQIKEGVVLLPPYITVETVIPADCEIRIVDKDGNVIEGGVIK